MVEGVLIAAADQVKIRLSRQMSKARPRDSWLERGFGCWTSHFFPLINTLASFPLSSQIMVTSGSIAVAGTLFYLC